MQILFIAPIPPPINGQSKASNMVLDVLKKDNEITIVNLSKQSLKSGEVSFSRFLKIISILKEVWIKRMSNDVIYISIAESTIGNIRDLLIYAICFKDIDKICLHMLGGAGMTNIIEGNGLLSKLNHFFLRRVGGVIVEGVLNYNIFSKYVDKNKVHIVPNFADDYLFLTEKEVELKFDKLQPLQILYLSNLIYGKGYKELLEAYLGLPTDIKCQINLTFVGGFESTNDEQEFGNNIKDIENIRYLGKVFDIDRKRALYASAHVFCLPTYYPFEGQPLSILEAYASGCVVITTNHSGIPFIHTDGINGWVVKKQSTESLKLALRDVFEKRLELPLIAKNNLLEATQKYRPQKFQEKITSIFNRN